MAGTPGLKFRASAYLCHAPRINFPDETTVDKNRLFDMSHVLQLLLKMLTPFAPQKGHTSSRLLA